MTSVKQGHCVLKTSPKVKSSEGSGIETDQAGQMDALLNQSSRVLSKNQEGEETDTSTRSKRDKIPAVFFYKMLLLTINIVKYAIVVNRKQSPSGKDPRQLELTHYG